MKIVCSFLIAIFTVVAACAQPNEGPTNKARLFVLSDIGNEPDDAMSMVRLMLYSNSIDIEGLCATTSIHMQGIPQPEMIRRTVRAYGQVRDNLLLHETGYPTADYLLSVVYSGQQGYGMKAVGKGRSSEGSRKLVEAILRKDSRPLWITAWGGANTLAQALMDLKASHSAKEMDAIIANLRVFTISDQDNAGFWIRKTFPHLFYIVSPCPYNKATWNGMMDDDPRAFTRDVIRNSWIRENIQQGHGPLGALYPDVAFGMEGDTPSFLGLIPNGLNDLEHPNWGSWGGRYEFYKPEFNPNDKWIFPLEPETRPIWTNAVDTVIPIKSREFGRTFDYDSTGTVASNKATLWRWRTEFQNDMAARMDWCVNDYKHANHPPVVKLGIPDRITVHSGDIFQLDARPSYDPDGDALSFFWMQYKEPSTYKQYMHIGMPTMVWLHTIVAPKVKHKETVHFILKVTDHGTPALTRYHRVIVTILP
jgi:hypothetical protein